ncbi:helix-turn-helix transcriptional regulator [Levilactobacillus hammesii]|uniref:XRE family transcriptional regulator n=1 Tax=Levilactobacillus hammesii DSM 16381 TaxID=1423753 RepID=A0A0R1UK90_9LACO|nr:helix-turn-helix domain-containing protein [Levilactobacillus hammesii]KRL93639.1 XRE family transcriptional regulator [Levilactobacillus hammesii DSM 16381]
MTLGEKLKQARADHHLTQQAVAKRVNVSRQTISSWETGKSYPDIDSLVVLSGFYGVSLDILIKEDTGMLGYLRKSAVMNKLRPIHQVMLILNFLFIVVLTFFLPSRLGGWVIIAATLANLVGFLLLQRFEEQLSSLPVWEQRWQSGWLPELVSGIMATLALIGTHWWSVSAIVSSNLVTLTLVSWLTFLMLGMSRVIGRLKLQEAKQVKK